MNLKIYFQTIYEEHLKYDLDDLKSWGKKLLYPFWLLKILYFYTFFIVIYPIVYLVYSVVTQEHIDALHKFQEARDMDMLKFVSKIGEEINDGAKFLIGDKDEKTK